MLFITPTFYSSFDPLRKISDYLDREHGAIFQVVHTGKGFNDISIKGDLKGASLRFHKSKKSISIITDNVPPLLSMVITGLAYFITEGYETMWRVLITALVFIVSIVVMAILAYWLEAKLPYPIPRDFKDFKYYPLIYAEQ